MRDVFPYSRISDFHIEQRSVSFQTVVYTKAKLGSTRSLGFVNKVFSDLFIFVAHNRCTFRFSSWCPSLRQLLVSSQACSNNAARVGTHRSRIRHGGYCVPGSMCFRWRCCPYCSFHVFLSSLQSSFRGSRPRQGPYLFLQSRTRCLMRTLILLHAFWARTVITSSLAPAAIVLIMCLDPLE